MTTIVITEIIDGIDKSTANEFCPNAIDKIPREVAIPWIGNQLAQLHPEIAGLIFPSRQSQLGDFFLILIQHTSCIGFLLHGRLL